MRAEAAKRLGRVDDVLAFVESGLSSVRETGQLIYEADLYRIQGEMLSEVVGREAESTASLNSSMEIALERGFSLIALRAALSLYRTARSDEERTSAKQKLAVAFETLTEGKGLPEVQLAHEILGDELSAERPAHPYSQTSYSSPTFESRFEVFEQFPNTLIKSLEINRRNEDRRCLGRPISIRGCGTNRTDSASMSLSKFGSSDRLLLMRKSDSRPVSTR